MIAIIPARGGSKGLPGKNIKELNGKPLIYYTIKAALDAKSVDKVIVSTDDAEIAEVAKKYGAEVPFLRPAELASDTSRAIDTYIYTIDRLMHESSSQIETFMVLLPTSPLRTSSDIDNAVDIYYSRGAETVISVVEADPPIDWHKKIDENGKLIGFFDNADHNANRQETKKTYVPNGAIYIFDYEKLNKNKDYYNPNTYPYVMDAAHSVDIDTLLDFRFAELLMRERGKIS